MKERILVICIDGTWNSDAENKKSGLHPTNVERIKEILVNDGAKQLVHYMPGVGIQGFVDRMVGGVWGAGIRQRISDGYRFLCENFLPGDRIALFGFSRGAFAVRGILGVVGRIGILPLKHSDKIEQAMSFYRRGHQSAEEIAFRDECATPTNIDFVGVWDTVIRHGPILAPLRYLLVESGLSGRFGLYDKRTGHWTRRVAHALALDETRSAFQPWRFEVMPEVPDQVIEECWFAGSHSDVGGGYQDSRASDVPLRWIAERAASAGIMLHRFPEVSKTNEAPIHNSREGKWRFLPSRKREVRREDRVHDSVAIRIQNTNYRSAARMLARDWEVWAKAQATRPNTKQTGPSKS